MNSTERYVTESELEKITKRSRKSWQRDRTNGNGPAFIKCGGKVLYDMKDIENWLNANKVKSTSEYSEKEKNYKNDPGMAVAERQAMQLLRKCAGLDEEKLN